MVSGTRLINNNKCLPKLICLQNIFHTNVMNDVTCSTFYLDRGGLSYPCKKVRGLVQGVLSEGAL